MWRSGWNELEISLKARLVKVFFVWVRSIMYEEVGIIQVKILMQWSFHNWHYYIVSFTIKLSFWRQNLSNFIYWKIWGLRGYLSHSKKNVPIKRSRRLPTWGHILRALKFVVTLASSRKTNFHTLICYSCDIWLC